MQKQFIAEALQFSNNQTCHS